MSVSGQNMHPNALSPDDAISEKFRQRFERLPTGLSSMSADVDEIEFSVSRNPLQPISSSLRASWSSLDSDISEGQQKFSFFDKKSSFLATQSYDSFLLNDSPPRTSFLDGHHINTDQDSSFLSPDSPQPNSIDSKISPKLQGLESCPGKHEKDGSLHHPYDEFDCVVNEPSPILDEAAPDPASSPRRLSTEGTPSRPKMPISREGTPMSFRRGRAIDQVQIEIPDVLALLSSKHGPWQDRIDALKRVSRFTTWQIAPSALAEACEPLINGLGIQLVDLRSQVVKQACSTIGDLAQCLGFHFEVFAENLFMRLCDLLRIAKKVMSSSGDECIRRIIIHSHVGSIKILIRESFMNKSPIVRCRCVEYITLALQKWDPHHLEVFRSDIGDIFTKVCCDSTKDVRSAGKRLFHQFAKIWPSDSSRIYLQFDFKMRKTIILEYPDLENVITTIENLSLSSRVDGSGDVENIHDQELPYAKLNFAEIKARIRRESSFTLGSASSDIITIAVPQNHSTPQVDMVANSPEIVLPVLKFEQPYSPERSAMAAMSPALSPIPLAFLEGFSSANRPTASDSTPLVKHSSLRFTSRVLGTPIVGRTDDFHDDESSSSSCTAGQLLDETEDSLDVSIASSIAAESGAVLSRADAREYPDSDSSTDDIDAQTNYCHLKNELQILSNCIRSMHSPSAASTCGSEDVQTVIINDDLISPSMTKTSAFDEFHSLVAPMSDCPTSPKDMINAVLSSPVPRSIAVPVNPVSPPVNKLPSYLTQMDDTVSPQRSPDVPFSESNSAVPNCDDGVQDQVDCSDGGDSSWLRFILSSIFIVFLSVIAAKSGPVSSLMSAFDQNAPPFNDHNLHYQDDCDDSVILAEPARRVGIPILEDNVEVLPLDDTNQGLILESITVSQSPQIDVQAGNFSNEGPLFQDSDGSEANQLSKVESCDENDENVCSNVNCDEQLGVACFERDVDTNVSTLNQDEEPDHEVVDATFTSEVELAQFATSPIIQIDQDEPTRIELQRTDEEIPEEFSELQRADEEIAEGFMLSLMSRATAAYLYAAFCGLFCMVAYIAHVRLRRTSTPIIRQFDFDVTGVTAAPEWDLDLDRVVPAGPSPSSRQGTGDFHSWQIVKNDGTSQTLFSPVRRSLRIMRKRRPTQF